MCCNAVFVRDQPVRFFSRKSKAPFTWSRFPETTLPQFNLAEVTFHLFLCKIQPTVYKRIANPSLRQLVWANCLALAGRVTLEGGTTFCHINTFGSPNRDNSQRGECHEMSRFRI